MHVKSALDSYLTSQVTRKFWEVWGPYGNKFSTKISVKIRRIKLKLK